MHFGFQHRHQPSPNTYQDKKMQYVQIFLCAKRGLIGTLEICASGIDIKTNIQ